MPNAENIKEIWKDVRGYESRYQISNFGRIKSLSRHIRTAKGFRITKEKIMIQLAHNSGYKSIGLRNGKTQKMFLMHRIVAIAFIENDDKTKIQINHINGIKTDNRVNNLEWVTPKQNSIHASKMGLLKGSSMKGEDNPSSKLTTIEVMEIKRLLKRKIAQRKIAKIYNVGKTTIGQIYRNETWITLNKH